MPYVPDDFGFPVLISPQRSLAELESILCGADMEADAPPVSVPVSKRAARRAEINRIGEIVRRAERHQALAAVHLANEFPALTVDQVLTLFQYWGSPASYHERRRQAARMASCKASVA